jgi:phage terminase large subunit-like protein
MQCSRKIFRYLNEAAAGKRTLSVLYGGRRAGKSWGIAQWLLFRVFNTCEQVLVVNATDNQGREGVYADMTDIVAENWGGYFERLKTPREFHTTFARNGKIGRIRFASFDESGKAKGGACDWAYLNEANMMTFQHYTDISVNARRGVICDFNPTNDFWISKLIDKSECLHLTWKDNERFLTEIQKQWFYDLKARAEAPDATDMDVYLYNVNYLGVYGGNVGKMFNSGNLPIVDIVPPQLSNMIITCDPSALCGGDYFACCLGGVGVDGMMYVIDTMSTNAADEMEVLQRVQDWCSSYDVRGVYIETNGIPGANFFAACRKSGLPVQPLRAVHKKFDRITANYNDMIKRLRVVQHDGAAEFMAQIYDFGNKCEHDDNIDALNYFFTLQKIFLMKNGIY